MSASCGPGANYFDPRLVQASATGVKLTVAKTAFAKWSSSEFWMEERLGYGTYVFQATGPFASLDKAVTYGLFTYDPFSTDTTDSMGGFGNKYYREIDIEITKWNVVCWLGFCVFLCILMFGNWNSEL